MEQNLFYLQVVQRRAIGPPQELDKISLAFRNYSAGFIGEKRVLFMLKELEFPHLVIHNFTSFNEAGHSIQMDILFICQHFLLILEVKNISGQVDFDETRRQFIRKTADGRLESFMSPVDQVLRHKYFLETLLYSWHEDVPIETAIVIANHSTIIGNISSEVPIFNVAGTRQFIIELCKKYTHVHLNMKAVHQHIMSHYVTRKPVLPQGQYTLQNGVFCNKCNHLMTHSSQGFKCFKCNSYDTSNESLLQSLWEFKLLYGDTITNTQFRKFTGVKSASTAKKMLKRIGLTPQNNGRAAYYSIRHLKNLL